MKKSRRSQWKLTRTEEAPAITNFVATRIQFGKRTQDAIYLFIFTPLTGKTHQLRVAGKSLGSPIAGDILYAAADEARKEERAYLHAYAIRVNTLSGPMQVVCPPKHGSLWRKPEIEEYVSAMALAQIPRFIDIIASESGLDNDDEMVWFANDKTLRSSLSEFNV